MLSFLFLQLLLDPSLDPFPSNVLMLKSLVMLLSSVPRQQGSCGQYGAHLGPDGPRWAPRWPIEFCYQGPASVYHSKWLGIHMAKFQATSIAYDISWVAFCYQNSVWGPLSPTRLSFCGIFYNVCGNGSHHSTRRHDSLIPTSIAASRSRDR